MNEDGKCQHEGCSKRATYHGDGLCEKHRWQKERFVWIEDDYDSAVGDEFERLMEERGWNVTVRESRYGEAGGHLYYVERGGTLQIMGFSIPVPDCYHDDSGPCWDEANESATKPVG